MKFNSDHYYKLSLAEINMISNPQEREYVMNFYKEELSKLSSDRLCKKIIQNNLGKSIEQIINELEKFFNNNTSLYIFPNDIILFYPTLKENQATTNLICHVTGAEIKKGSFYYRYRPLLENISNNHIYVLDKTIKAENTEIAFFPTTISEFDDLSEKIDNSYQSSLTEEEYDYYAISRRIGGRLHLRKLR